ncbi:MAG: caspase family protein [Fibrobacterales bacterium]
MIQKLLIVFLLSLSLVTVSWSSVERIGLFIGNNNGLFNERDLSYATRDAREMAAVFRDSKNFDADRVYLLENPSLEKITSSLNQIQGRIAELHKSNKQSMLVFYYSGHGSSDALHIDGKKFDRTTLLSTIESVQSDVKIIIVDACESGKLLRKKGGTFIREDNVVAVDTLKNKGTVIITSSGADEFSLESEEYKGAVFTHHLLNGLHGLADFNSDSEIGLWEAFYYARLSTQSDNMVRQAIQQSPGFDFDLVGETDIVLTELKKGNGEIVFKDFPSVPVNIYNSQTMELYSRLNLSGKKSVRYKVPVGNYVASFEGEGHFKAMRVDLTWAKSQEISPKQFKRQPKSVIYTKGGHGFILDPLGVEFSVGGSDPTNVNGVEFGPLPTFMNYYLSLIYRAIHLKNRVTLGYAEDDVDGRYFAVDRLFLSLRLESLTPVWTSNYTQLQVGAAFGLVHLWEEVIDKRYLEVNPERVDPITHTQGNIFSLGVPVELECYLPYGSWISFGYQISSSFFKQENGRFKLHYQGGPRIGLGVQF